MRIIDLFDRAAARYPGQVFLVQGGISRQYRESQDASYRIAAALLRDGFGKGARVGLYGPNDWRGVEALFGTFRAGAIAVPVNARNAIVENIDFLNDAGVELLFIHSNFAEYLPQIALSCRRIRRLILLDGDAGKYTTISEYQAEAGLAFTPFDYRADDVWSIYGTSGTTGRAKCVAHTHLTAMSAMADMLHSMAVHAPVRHLVVAPISHFAGIFFYALTAMGSTHFFLEGTAPKDILDAIENLRAEILFLPPTLVYMMLDQLEVETRDFSGLKAMICAGSPMSPDRMRRAIEVFGPVMMNFLGQTEAVGPITALTPLDYIDVPEEKLKRRLGSIGRPSLMRQVEIMDNDGTLLPAGGIGEIVLRGWGVTPGYVMPDGSLFRDEELFSHGWMHTGDIGRKDEDGFFTILDRKKDMIISGGFNIYPVEVERVLLTHPAIADVAVIGVPDDKWGEAVKAVVELKPGASADAAAIIGFCKASIGSVKAPKSIEFWPQLPRNATGKILKRVVRDKFWQGRERRV